MRLRRVSVGDLGRSPVYLPYMSRKVLKGVKIVGGGNGGGGGGGSLAVLKMILYNLGYFRTTQLAEKRRIRGAPHPKPMLRLFNQYSQSETPMDVWDGLPPAATGQVLSFYLGHSARALTHTPTPQFHAPQRRPTPSRTSSASLFTH